MRKSGGVVSDLENKNVVFLSKAKISNHTNRPLSLFLSHTHMHTH